jgi:hypothetical protein
MKVVGVGIIAGVIICVAPFLLVYFLYDRTLKHFKKEEKVKVKNETSNFLDFLSSVRGSGVKN